MTSKMDRRETLAKALLSRYGRTFAQELGIELDKNTPAPLFQLLTASILFSARIPFRNASRAARALFDASLQTPQRMAKARWQERVDVLTNNGYKRFDERTATMLGETAELLLDRYDGDLRRLREQAQREVAEERRRLMQFKGMGPVGADIFLREVQVSWSEVYPYADGKVLKAARRLGLGGRARDLAKLTTRRSFAALTAALVRTDLEDAYDEVREAA